MATTVQDARQNKTSTKGDEVEIYRKQEIQECATYADGSGKCTLSKIRNPNLVQLRGLLPGALYCTEYMPISSPFSIQSRHVDRRHRRNGRVPHTRLHEFSRCTITGEHSDQNS